MEGNSVMEIPPHNKRPGYSGYPSTTGLHDDNHNATPGPSHPKTTTHSHLPHNQTSDAHRTKPDSTPRPSPSSNRHQDNPGDPDNISSSDKTYLPSSTRYSNTESDITDSESCERSSRTLHHRRTGDEHQSHSSNQRNH